MLQGLSREWTHFKHTIQTTLSSITDAVLYTALLREEETQRIERNDRDTLEGTSEVTQASGTERGTRGTPGWQPRTGVIPARHTAATPPTPLQGRIFMAEGRIVAEAPSQGPSGTRPHIPPMASAVAMSRLPSLFHCCLSGSVCLHRALWRRPDTDSCSGRRGSRQEWLTIWMLTQMWALYLRGRPGDSDRGPPPQLPPARPPCTCGCKSKGGTCEADGGPSWTSICPSITCRTCRGPHGVDPPPRGQGDARGHQASRLSYHPDDGPCGPSCADCPWVDNKHNLMQWGTRIARHTVLTARLE